MNKNIISASNSNCIKITITKISVPSSANNLISRFKKRIGLVYNIYIYIVKIKVSEKARKKVCPNLRKLKRSTNLVGSLWWIYSHPQQRYDDSNKTRPHKHNCWCSSSSPHQPFCKGIQMCQNPEAEEHPPEQSAPLRYHAVDRPADPHRYPDQVHHHDHDRRDHQGRPFH